MVFNRKTNLSSCYSKSVVLLNTKEDENDLKNTVKVSGVQFCIAYPLIGTSEMVCNVNHKKYRLIAQKLDGHYMTE